MSTNLFKYIKILRSFLKDYFFTRSSLKLAAVATVVALFYIKSVTPEFLISTELTVSEDNNSAPTQQSSISTLLTLGNNSRPQDEFIVNAYSISNAKYLWELGYAQEIYPSLYDSENNSFRPKNVTLTNRLASIIVGYKINNTLDETDLQDFIRSKVKISSDEISKTIDIKMQYHDPDLAKRLMYDLITGADIVAKDYILEKSESRVSNILEDLNTTQHPQVIKEGLVNLVNTNLFKITSANSDAPLSVNFIQDPVSTQNPVFPRPFLIIFCFIFVTLVSSYLIKFLIKNRNEFY